jgi:hypothetical protein
MPEVAKLESQRDRGLHVAAGSDGRYECAHGAPKTIEAGIRVPRRSFIS